jgi:alpha-tubulin suppressor-like RCC1 family protein
VAIAAGLSHSLALKADGTVVAWGSNSEGQTDLSAGLANVAAIAAGGWYEQGRIGTNLSYSSGFSLALKTDGTVVAWGAGWATTEVPAALTNVVAIAAGPYPGFGVGWRWPSLPPGACNTCPMG